ncbi:LCP family protein [Gemella sp. zg-570]|uniref:LCP family protein n=1 Tax=Gemella sp. zg-570 TaxID=2840371 RepID=UPI001C0D9EBD|nr:LCP family protein [Gemella sp. zg-570]QWQ39087.1 LCP family protein [Gemella sp. zg-570]
MGNNTDKNQYSRLSRVEKVVEENKKKRKRWRRILYTFLFLLVATSGFLIYTWGNFSSNVKQGFKHSENTEQVDPNFKKFSLLIMGIDENDSRAAEGQTRENSRTDSLVLLTVNKDKNRMDMVSIPRDSFTLMRNSSDKNDPSAYFFDKITHAHVYGGSDGTIEAVSNLLNVPINFYVVVNFKAFEQVVDSLGGVKLYVPFDMVEQNSNGEQGTIHLKQGWHNLKGEEALAFARTRYHDSDIERGQRQLQIIHAIIDKAKSLNALAKVNELISIGGDNVTHNMTTSQITSAVSMFATNNINIVSHRIGGYDANMAGVYYYYPKPSHLLYVSSVLNNTLDNNLPMANDLINIHYQGYIVPLIKKYEKSTVKPAANFYRTANYVNLAAEDLLQYLPKQLTIQDLANDPTISNENRPKEDTSKEKSDKKQ